MVSRDDEDRAERLAELMEEFRVKRDAAVDDARTAVQRARRTVKLSRAARANANELHSLLEQRRKRR